MSVHCPSCGSHHVITRNVGRKIGGATGAAAGTASGAAGALSGAKAGALVVLDSAVLSEAKTAGLRANFAKLGLTALEQEEPMRACKVAEPAE